MADLIISAEPRKTLEVDLVGQTYKVTAPKAALGLKIAIRAKQSGDDPGLMMDAVEEWVVKAFGKSAAKKVLARVDDENDDLDIQHLMKLMEAVIEATTGDPTG